jgi:hypothetical protein
VTDVGILDGVVLGNPKKKLRTLSLCLLQNLTEALVLRMSYVYENLLVLDLGGVSLAVTDHSLQMIFRHMRLLRFLNVDSCCKVKSSTPSQVTELTFGYRLQISDLLGCLRSTHVVFIP